jgi:hypothetical protein
MANTKKTQCRCPRCRIRGLMGPVMLIAIGGIFLTGEYTPYGFVQLWPILLVIPGLLLLAQSAASSEGHINS